MTNSPKMGAHEINLLGFFEVNQELTAYKVARAMGINTHHLMSIVGILRRKGHLFEVHRTNEHNSRPYALKYLGYFETEGGQAKHIMLARAKNNPFSMAGTLPMGTGRIGIVRNYLR